MNVGPSETKLDEPMEGPPTIGGLTESRRRARVLVSGDPQVAA
jgi:hypothetical protein